MCFLCSHLSFHCCRWYRAAAVVVTARAVLLLRSFCFSARIQSYSVFCSTKERKHAKRQWRVWTLKTDETSISFWHLSLVLYPSADYYYCYYYSALHYCYYYGHHVKRTPWAEHRLLFSRFVPCRHSSSIELLHCTHPPLAFYFHMTMKYMYSNSLSPPLSVSKQINALCWRYLIYQPLRGVKNCHFMSRIDLIAPCKDNSISLYHLSSALLTFLLAEKEQTGMQYISFIQRL